MGGPRKCGGEAGLAFLAAEFATGQVAPGKGLGPGPVQRGWASQPQNRGLARPTPGDWSRRAVASPKGLGQGWGGAPREPQSQGDLVSGAMANDQRHGRAHPE
eukprot:2447394-Heterocapsa_arctica.AAC.1